MPTANTIWKAFGAPGWIRPDEVASSGQHGKPTCFSAAGV
jgi:hypothetical protein